MSAELQSPVLTIRTLSSADVRDIHRIEKRAYEFPWSQRIFADCLSMGYRAWGLMLGGELAGYSLITAAAGEAHLLNHCIAPEWHGRGYGRVLLRHLLQQLQAAHIEILFLEVRPSNPAAVHLYESEGFRQIGRRPGYYQAADGREDALVMSLRIGAET